MPLRLWCPTCRGHGGDPATLRCKWCGQQIPADHRVAVEVDQPKPGVVCSNAVARRLGVPQVRTIAAVPRDTL